MASEPSVSKVTHRRIRAAWQGRKPSLRKLSEDQLNEQDILDTVGDCKFVCTVHTETLAPARAEEKSLVAARMALTAISLLWRTPSKALSGFSLLFDGNVHHRVSLNYRAGNRYFGSSRSKSKLPYGPRMKAEEWERLYSDASMHFAVAGEAIHLFLNANSPHRRTPMMSVLFHSLLWFHEACQESSSLIAVVKFSASMDALAGGEGESSICKLLAARVGLKEDAVAFSDGSTTKTVVKRLYNYGRSRTIHGSNNQFAYDWSQERGRAEQLARLALVHCIEWIATNKEASG